MANSVGKWFKWKTDGGGKGYVVSEIGTELHYGDVDLQVSDPARPRTVRMHHHALHTLHSQRMLNTPWCELAGDSLHI